MLDIRYTKRDVAPWIDMLFAPVFVLIGFSFLSKSDLAISLADQSRGFWAFALLMLYAVFAFIRGLILWRSSRVGRLFVRIENDGLRFYGRSWYTAWTWREVEFMPWHKLTAVIREPGHIVFKPKGLLYRFLWRHLIWRQDIQPSLVHNWIDQTPSDIINAIRAAAPDIEITEGKQGYPRHGMKLSDGR